MTAHFPILIAFGWIKMPFLGEIPPQPGAETGNECLWSVTREAERQWPSRDRSEKPGHVEKLTCLNKACSRNEPGKAREETRMLRPGKLDNSKHIRRKGPAKRRRSWAGKCLWSPLLTLMSQVLLAEWNEPRKRKKHSLTFLLVLIQNVTPPPNEVFVSTVPVCKVMHTAVLKRNCWLTPFPKLHKINFPPSGSAGFQTISLAVSLSYWLVGKRVHKRYQALIIFALLPLTWSFHTVSIKQIHPVNNHHVHFHL